MADERVEQVAEIEEDSLEESPSEQESQPSATQPVVEVDGQRFTLEDIRNLQRMASEATRRMQELARDREQLAKTLAERINANQAGKSSKSASPSSPSAEDPLKDILRRELEQVLMEREAAIRQVTEDLAKLEQTYGKQSDEDRAAILQVMAERNMNAQEAFAFVMGQKTLQERTRQNAETTMSRLANMGTEIPASSSAVVGTTQPRRGLKFGSQEMLAELMNRMK
jgi:hypothetical protein